MRSSAPARAIHRGERALELRTLWTQGGLGLLTAVRTAAALVWVVREAAGVTEFVTATPHGYDTMLSLTFAGGSPGAAVPPTGTTLSGGQWQRLALARCLMRMDRDLLILDEPSSGLDAEAEHAIHQQLRKARAGRTSVLISHRFSTIRDADTIVVLTDGRIGESGTHAELMAADGEYRRLFELQAAGYLDEPAAPVVPIGRPGHIGAVAVRRS